MNKKSNSSENASPEESVEPKNDEKCRSRIPIDAGVEVEDGGGDGPVCDQG